MVFNNFIVIVIVSQKVKTPQTCKYGNNIFHLVYLQLAHLTKVRTPPLVLEL